MPMNAPQLRSKQKARYCDKGGLWWACSRWPGHEGPCWLHARFANYRHWHDFRVEYRGGNLPPTPR